MYRKNTRETSDFKKSEITTICRAAQENLFVATFITGAKSSHQLRSFGDVHGSMVIYYDYSGMGNHESAMLREFMAFMTNVSGIFNENLGAHFTWTHSTPMPIAAVVASKDLSVCMVDNIDRPTIVPEYGLLNDYYGDPTKMDLMNGKITSVEFHIVIIK
ncbi:Serine/threonine-protein phosphatase PP1 isozyme 5 [Lucilia cuprina]|nr:Serine/threonine-protein phosphatase PP1 isozyme 5 [Lucilia cuprina]